MAQHTSRVSVAETLNLNCRMKTAVEEIQQRLTAVSALTDRHRHYKMLNEYDFERMPIFRYSHDVLRTMCAHEGPTAALEVALLLPFAWELSLYAAVPDVLPTYGEAMLAEIEAEAAANPLQFEAVISPDPRTLRRGLTRTFTHITRAKMVARVMDSMIHNPPQLTIR